MLGRPAIAPRGKVDDEGNPDVTSNLIAKLKKHGRLDEEILEMTSLDWRSERKLMQQWMQGLARHPRWRPRVGEIVLYARNLKDDQEIRFTAEGPQRYRIWSQALRGFGGHPHWEAGVVSQESLADLSLADLTRPQDKGTSLNQSGFRIEAYPNPNSDDKPESSQAKYLALAHIRPFVFHEQMLAGIAMHEWHRTIQHTLVASSTVSLVNKLRFTGAWPTCAIRCKGVYIGHELITVGDVVRLLPDAETPDEVTDVLFVKAIKLRMWNLDKASLAANGHPYNSAIHLEGRIYTTKPMRSTTSFPIAEMPAALPKGLDDYGQWFSKYEPHAVACIPFTRVLGRCHEFASLAALFPHLALPDTGAALSLGLAAIVAGRAYSAANLRQVDRAAGKTWHFADCRTEALDLRSFNGADVGVWDERRDAERWRKELRVLDGTASAADRRAVAHAGDEYVPIKLRRGSLLAGANTMVRNALVEGDDDDDEESGSGSAEAMDVDMPERAGADLRAGGWPAAKKRSRSVMESGDDSGSIEGGRKMTGRMVIEIDC